MGSKRKLDRAKERQQSYRWGADMTLVQSAWTTEAPDAVRPVACALCGTELHPREQPFVVLGAAVRAMYIDRSMPEAEALELAAQPTRGRTVMLAVCLGCLPKENNA